MSTQNVFCAILSLAMFFGSYSVPKAQSIMTVPNERALEELSIEELTHQIRRDKFDQILPQIMREHNIDMWIQVMTEGIPDPMRDELGSNNGVFIFTDRGGDRIERAVIGHRWKPSARGSGFIRAPYLDVVRETGAYDIIAEESLRQEKPGGPKSELDHRFEGVGEFVSERDPKVIALNYLEDLGLPVVYEIPRIRSDGISFTGYNLLVKEVGEIYAERFVSAEYLIYDYLSRRVDSEIVMFKKIRKWLTETVDADFRKIVPGETRHSDLQVGGLHYKMEDGGRGRRGGVVEGGDLIQVLKGRQSHHYMDDSWIFGNFYEDYIAYGYVLREDETEPPPKVKRAWEDALTVRKIFVDNIKVGRTAGETFEILKQKINEAGLEFLNTHETKNALDPEKTLVALDLHAAGKGINGPRISPLGPDWQRDYPLALNHHPFFEYWVYVPMPEWGEGRYLTLQFHDGAIVTERGVEYVAPPPTELRLIR